MDKLWYVRRNGHVKGPFNTAQIQRLVLLGRVRQTDELSTDQMTWRVVSMMPELVPDAIREGTDEDGLRRLRQREDERGSVELRVHAQATTSAGADTRVRPDRRAPEDAETLSMREAKVQLLQEVRSRQENYRPRWLGMMATLLVILALSLLLAPGEDEDVPQCGAPPGPAVNWSNCRLEELSVARKDLSGAKVRNAKLRQANLFGTNLVAADLAYTDLVKANLSYANLTRANLKGTNLLGADLAYANLSEADLTFADLTQAVLGGAVLDGAQLDNAIWLDGQVCAPGSVGRCLNRISR